MITLAERLKTQTEIYRKLLDQFSSDLRVASPGIIQSFDAGTQTVTVQLTIREKININGNLEWTDIPLLVDVPIFMPRAGGYLLTMPVSPGDECLVIFGDMCIDAWWQNGGVQNQIDKRRHDLSDGFALVGVWSQPRKVTGYSPNSTQLRNEAGNAVVEVSGTTININTAGNVVIQGRDFMNHTHSGVIPGGGSTGGVV